MVRVAMLPRLSAFSVLAYFCFKALPLQNRGLPSPRQNPSGTARWSELDEDFLTKIVETVCRSKTLIHRRELAIRGAHYPPFIGRLSHNETNDYLGHPGWNDCVACSATGINDAGVIAGFYQTPDGGVHGYTFQNGSFTTIDDPNAFPGSNGFPTFTEVLSINNGGDVVGFSTDRFGLAHSFLLSDGVFHRIDVPAAAGGTIAFGLNDNDQVTGQFTDVNNNTHGFLFSRSNFRTVDVPGALITQPMQINSSGRIVGTYIDSTGTFHSFLAEPQDDDSDPGDAAGIAAPQSAVQNGAAPLTTNAPARPCPVPQPGSPNQTTRMLSCNSQP